MPETAEMEVHSPAWRGARDVERACIVLLDAELDIALGYLRIADAEINAAHAEELITKATQSYQIVINGLPTMSPGLEEEKLVLRQRVRLLQDAIRAAIRRRQHNAELHQFG